MLPGRADDARPEQPSGNGGEPGDDYECCMCLDVLVEPVTLPCGHDGCRECLLRLHRNAQRSKQPQPAVCPQCRSRLPNPPFSVNIRLQKVLLRDIPLRAQQRLDEVTKAKQQRKEAEQRKQEEKLAASAERKRVQLAAQATARALAQAAAASSRDAWNQNTWPWLVSALLLVPCVSITAYSISTTLRKDAERAAAFVALAEGGGLQAAALHWQLGANEGVDSAAKPASRQVLSGGGTNTLTLSRPAGNPLQPPKYEETPAPPAVTAAHDLRSRGGRQPHLPLSAAHSSRAASAVAGAATLRHTRLASPESAVYLPLNSIP